jgi:hypothetical protein
MEQIRLYDSQSVMVLNEAAQNRQRISLDLSGFAGGVYLLQVIRQDGVLQFAKLVVE